MEVTMPIPQEDINTNWIWVAPNETVGQIQGKLPADRKVRAFKYIVFETRDGTYIVVRWIEIEQLAAARGQDIRGTPISMLQGLPMPVIGIEQDSMGLTAAREERDAQPGRRLVVLSNGRAIGLLTAETLTADALPPDPFASIPKRPTVLGIEDDDGTPKAPVPAPSAPAAGEPAPPPQGDDRVFNVCIDEPEKETTVDKTEPLQLRTTYDLKINVASPRKDAIITAGGVNSLMDIMPEDQDFIEVLVMIETSDFNLYGYDQQLLIVPRVGRSKNSVTFSIEPKKKGPGVITAVLVVNGNVFQRITITLQAGELAPGSTRAITAKSSGVSIGSAVDRPKREEEQQVNLIIIKDTAGYKFIAQNGGVKRAAINLSEAQIDEMIGQARTALRDLVYKQDADGNYLYQQSDTTIAPEVHAAALKSLAWVGTNLYNKLFYSPGTSEDAHSMGDLLRQVSQKQSLHIKVVAERFIFPWTLLYDREYFGDVNEAVDAEGFWGFKHIVEYAPEFTSATPINFTPLIKAEGPLQFTFLANTTIDDQLGIPVIQEQRDFVQTLQGATVTQYTNKQEFFTLLRNADTPTQLLYIYCHAMSNLPGEKGGVAGSKLLLSDGAVTLDDLNMRAPIRGPIMKAAPLVFLNACQGAELSPYLYDGLVPYLIARGARGVIGTEVDTPALFAAEFAKEFLTKFIAGDTTLGDLLLEMRRKYVLEKNNVMGLVYALYSSGDVVVQRSS